MKNNNIEIRRLQSEEIPAALDLCLQVFMQFEAPEYPQEGIQAFRAVLDNAEWIDKMDFYGAVDNGLPIGVLAMRSPQHIGLFFVRAENQHKGIGRALFKAMRQNYTVQEFTVNASPYAVKIYEHLGFIPTAAEQLTDGIRYTPMIYKKDRINNEIPSNVDKIMKERFGKDSLIALATVEDNNPFVRYVNAFYKHGSFYVITYALSNKMRQIKQNNTVGLAAEWFTGHAIAENMGWFGKAENKEIAAGLRVAFKEWIDNGHNNFEDENTVILRLKLKDGILFSDGLKYDFELSV